jgi:hypothetical protein
MANGMRKLKMTHDDIAMEIQYSVEEKQAVKHSKSIPLTSFVFLASSMNFTYT